MEQWCFRSTAYADELLAGLEKLDWPEHVLAMQRNWIGRGEGVSFSMEIALSDEKVLRQINGRRILKAFYVKGRLINLVTA